MSDDLIYRHPAKVLKPSSRERDILLALFEDRGLDAGGETPFFWTAEISNTLLDFYSTHMLDSTLHNFVDDSIAGVGFMNSHRHNELPFGRSLTARFEQATNRNRALADFYTIPGINLNGVKTDDLIAGIRTGIISDVSVGFYGGKWWCDICGGNYLRYDSCQHFAGSEVETKEGLVTVTVGIDGARLSEVSGVYDGATPDATIIKAQRAAEDGDLDPKTRLALERRYRMTLPTRTVVAGVDIPNERANTMDSEKLLEEIRTALKLDEDADVVATVTDLRSQALRVTSLEDDRNALADRLEAANRRISELDDEIDTLQVDAENGRTYRTDLIEEALSAGVRAHGNKFDRAVYEGTLQSAPLSTIKRMRDDWMLIGDTEFSGGRRSVDSSEAPPNQRRRGVHVPETAYRV